MAPKSVSSVSNAKPRPEHVPEENLYDKMHWMVVLAYIAAAVAVGAMLINAG